MDVVCPFYVSLGRSSALVVSPHFFMAHQTHLGGLTFNCIPTSTGFFVVLLAGGLAVAGDLAEVAAMVGVGSAARS